MWALTYAATIMEKETGIKGGNVMQNDVLWGIAAGALTAGGLSAFAVWHDEQALCNGDPVLVCQGGGGSSVTQQVPVWKARAW